MNQIKCFRTSKRTFLHTQTHIHTHTYTHTRGVCDGRWRQHAQCDKCAFAPQEHTELSLSRLLAGGWRSRRRKSRIRGPIRNESCIPARLSDFHLCKLPVPPPTSTPPSAVAVISLLLACARPDGDRDNSRPLLTSL